MRLRFFHLVLLTALFVNIFSYIETDEESIKHAPFTTASLGAETSPVVSAVLLECPKISKKTIHKKFNQRHSEQQLMVNIRVDPSFQIEQVEKFLILDEVYDPRKRSKAKIMSPYLVEISRGEPIMMYPLQFMKSVSSEPMQNATLIQSLNTGNARTNVELVKDTSINEDIENCLNHNSIKSNNHVERTANTPITDYEDNNDNELNLSMNIDDHKLINSKAESSIATDHLSKDEEDYNEEYLGNVGIENSLLSTLGENPNIAQVDLVKKSLNNYNGKTISRSIPKSKHSKSVHYSKPFGNRNHHYSGFNKEYVENDNEDIALNDASVLNSLSDNNEEHESSRKDHWQPDLFDDDYPESFSSDYDMKTNPQFANGFKSCHCNGGSMLKSEYGLDKKMEDMNSNMHENNENINNKDDIYYDVKSDYYNSKFQIGRSNPPARLHYNKRQNKNSAQNVQYKTKEMNSNQKNGIIEKLPYRHSSGSEQGNSRNQYNEKNKQEMESHKNNKLNRLTLINGKLDINIQDKDDNINRKMSDSLSERMLNVKYNSNAPKLTQHAETQNNKNIVNGKLGHLNKNIYSNEYWNIKNEEHMKKLHDELAKAANSDVGTKKYKIADTWFAAYNGYLDKKPSNAMPSLYENKGSSTNYKRPYKDWIAHPDLSTLDKLQAIEVMDPPNDKKDEELKILSDEVYGPFFIKPTPYPIPFEIPPLKNDLKLSETNKKKRSFILYDDLQIKDTFDDTDYIFDNSDKVNTVPNSQRGIMDDDIQSCATCGGKGKKPQGKPNPSIHNTDNDCNCRGHRSSCQCEPIKQHRSVADTWYSVFNMSAPMPFLTMKIQVFRKRRNTWWKIAPSITLSSMSGIFANENLSILFSSHVDIFQLEKSLRLQNHKLIFEKEDRKRTITSRQLPQNTMFNLGSDTYNIDYLNKHPNHIFTVDNQLDLDSMAFIKELKQRATNKNKDIRNSETSNDIHSIGELGYFPVSMNLLEQCPNDKNRLCLNILDNKVPAFNIKLKMPFRENCLLYEQPYKMKIINIITDATTTNALQVHVDVINEGFRSAKMSVAIINCAATNGGNKSVIEKMFLPHRRETITFILPLLIQSDQNHKKVNCDVGIRTIPTTGKPKNETKSTPAKTKVINKVVAVRQFKIETGNRCFCIWYCACHCIQKLETHVDYNVCQKLTKFNEKQAGLLLPSDSCFADDDILMNGSGDNDQLIDQITHFHGFLINALLLFFFMFILGFLKAMFGLCCSERIDRYGYDFIQPGKGYKCSSRFRRFCVNTFFFLVFPFLFLCKCFTPTEEDLLVATTEWRCSVVDEGRTQSNFSNYSSPDSNNYLDDDCDEDEIFTQNIKHGRCLDRLSGGADAYGIEERFPNLNVLNDNFLYDENGSEEEDAINSKLVVKALVKSRQSILKLVEGNPNNNDILYMDNDIESLKNKSATKCVEELIKAQIVYRIFKTPLGNVYGIPAGKEYCIQGYFLPSFGSEYEFVNYYPLSQYRCFSGDGTVKMIRPPNVLNPSDFTCVYKNKLQVLMQADLFVKPPDNVPCINIFSIPAIEPSIKKLAFDYKYNEPWMSTNQQHQLNEHLRRNISEHNALNNFNNNKNNDDDGENTTNQVHNFENYEF